ncbi:hypothetical protein [Pseudonocardia abyssalis]|uniref:Fe/B12 periplasmic-binding domain-containing protein n=1 Tax=Pseudonocardia abyssalis TaxID=2792008 RepID=A0ABS6UQJ8_9PSEU|nr:hypothetical protein [Pseudonocardia abyssalis]MBW0115793.1 hypothetical protein [Pseudonocardia abyssalis]MBW0134530.1 hypothetical protein [Pseudonocardia abyssalis]
MFAGIGTTVPDSTVELSPETIGQLDRDALVVLGANEADLTGDAVFQGLGAVADGRAVYVPGDGDFAGAVGFGNPLSLPYAAELITPQLAAVLG